MRSALLDDSDTAAASDGWSASNGGGGKLRELFSTSSPPPITRRTFTLLLIGASLMAVALLGLLLLAVQEERGKTAAGGGAGSEAAGRYIGSGVQQADLWRHLTALQAIADSNGGTRAIGHSGFNATVAYIRSVLANETDYDILQQPFVTTAWNQGPPSISLSIGSSTSYWRYQTDYHVLTYSGSVLASAAPVYAVAQYGCAAADYAAVNFSSGGVALVPSGQCGNAAKVSAASLQGAVAVLIYQSRSVRTFLPGSVAEGSPIAAFLLMYDTGAALAEAVYGRQGAVTAALNLTTSIAPTGQQPPAASSQHERAAERVAAAAVLVVPSLTVCVCVAVAVAGVSNVCATTKYGNRSNTIISGSHCDSVPGQPSP